jgi:hypothetical protein
MVARAYAIGDGIRDEPPLPLLASHATAILENPRAPDNRFALREQVMHFYGPPGFLDTSR